MISRLILLLIITEACLSLPQAFQLPTLTNFPPPEEINALKTHNQHERSIVRSVEIQKTEETVKEVEELIKSNPALPRLTRGEILDILENITKQDQNKLTPEINERDPKAIMVVKAYTPLGSGEVNIEDLYTKPPVTNIVESENGSAEDGSTTIRANGPYFRRKPTKDSGDKKVSSADKRKPYRGSSQFKTSTTTTRKPYSRRTTTSTVTTTTDKEVKRRRRPPVTPHTSTVTTYHPRRRVPATRTTKHPNHKYPEEPDVSSSDGLRIVEAPKLKPSEINYELEDLEPQEGALKPEFVGSKNKPMPSVEVQIPDHLKKVVADLNLAAIDDPDSFTITSIRPTANNADSEKIKDLLASIGVIPPSTTTSKSAPSAEIVAENLSPEMRELLTSFGLLNGPTSELQKENQVVDFVPEKAAVNPESYVGFKPLPEDTDSRKEMEDLLTRFGLLERNGRRQKSLKNDDDKGSDYMNFDVVPDEYRSVLDDMGLVRKSGRKIREEPSERTTEKQHVFNPVGSQHASKEEMEKLGKLLNIMKKLEKLNGTVTQEDLKKIDTDELREIISYLNENQKSKFFQLNQQRAPDPLEEDVGISKNEVKRQESSSTTEIADPTTTEKSETPSIKDLEDSFGGGSSTASTTTEAPETTTAARRSGFYYLMDWNSFFEIDDQKGKRVNLRFQPKVGDPKRFFSVTVP